MRIVNRTEFLKLPAWVVYSNYQSLGMIDGLFIKGESLPNDWIYQDLIGEVECNGSEEFADVMLAAEDGDTFSLDLFCASRDGAYEDSNMFVVYDKDDLDKLAGRLSYVLKRYPATKERSE